LSRRDTAPQAFEEHLLRARSREEGVCHLYHESGRFENIGYHDSGRTGILELQRAIIWSNMRGGCGDAGVVVDVGGVDCLSEPYSKGVGVGEGGLQLGQRMATVSLTLRQAKVCESAPTTLVAN
jgi:hypothetical protein